MAGHAARRGDRDKAIADYTEAVRLDPEYAVAYCNRGLAYSKKGDHDEAIADFTAAIRINPNDGYTFYVRGYSYWQTGDKAKADADFAQAEQLGYKAKPGRPGCPNPMSQ